MTRYFLLFLSLLTFVSISRAEQIYVASNTSNTSSSNSNSGNTSTSQSPPPSPWSNSYKPNSPLPQSNPLPPIPNPQNLPQFQKLPQIPIPNTSTTNSLATTSPPNANQTPAVPNSPATPPPGANNNLNYNNTFKAKWMETCTKGSGSNSIMLSQKFCECGWDKITAQIPVQSWLNQSPQNLAQMNVQLKVILQECQVAVQTGS